MWLEIRRRVAKCANGAATSAASGDVLLCGSQPALLRYLRASNRRRRLRRPAILSIRARESEIEGHPARGRPRRDELRDRRMQAQARCDLFAVPSGRIAIVADVVDAMPPPSRRSHRRLRQPQGRDFRVAKVRTRRIVWRHPQPCAPPARQASADHRPRGSALPLHCKGSIRSRPHSFQKRGRIWPPDCTVRTMRILVSTMIESTARDCCTGEALPNLPSRVLAPDVGDRPGHCHIELSDVLRQTEWNLAASRTQPAVASRLVLIIVT